MENELLKSIKIFCLHHTDRPERKERLQKIFKRENLEVEWVEDFHPSTIKISSLNLQHNLNINAISVYLKHKHCYLSQKHNQYDNILILEDDVIIPENIHFSTFFNSALKEFNSISGDLLFIGGAFNMHPSEILDHKIVYSEPHFTSRCAHAYVVNLKCIDRILSRIDVIDDALDWKLNHIIKEFNLKVCYTEPSIKQATVEGLDSSTIQH